MEIKGVCAWYLRALHFISKDMVSVHSKELPYTNGVLSLC